MATIHYFNIELARKIGIEAAIILENLNFWITKNKANERHFHDGKYWTYNSVKAFSALFPYMSERKIAYTLKKLQDLKYIETGNYNSSPYDKTKWYTITKLGYSILQNCNIDNAENDNRESEEVESIIYNNIDDTSTDTKQPDINPNSKQPSTPRRKVNASDELCDCVDRYTEDEEIRELLYEWLEVRKSKGSTKTVSSIEKNLKKLDEFANASNMTVKNYLEEVVRRGWQAFFVIKDTQTTIQRTDVKQNGQTESAAERKRLSGVTYL